ncbi:diaminopimelate epimerase [Candidatus Soleaferrea massiliensis]|uniref:diaminopimelate epimerase n=1 Tax=Candidatus Soleaferrea massiliensis TaxID=1470354 RepID=UPI00058E1C47|nr:diaminopimelate epimerase [Candidatus Soleaferrea massiliensis]
MVSFTKMHGLGNDYVYVNCLENTLDDPARFSVFVSRRHFCVGSDGLVLILPSDTADFKMRMFNADGSEGRMCGNAIRCVGKYVYDHGLTEKTELTVETLSGIKTLRLSIKHDKVELVEVDMGKAVLTAADIPVATELERFINQPVMVGHKLYNLTCVSMGNPHAVIFKNEIDALNLEEIGPQFEHHKLFPDRINTEFVEVLDDHTLKMRVWERGSGETFACGTGACASVVAAVVNSRCPRDAEITVHLRGGDLTATYRSDGSVLMKGSATHVFDGCIDFE